MSGFVQSTTTQSAAATSVGLSLTGVTAGNTLIIECSASGGSGGITFSITGDAGNTWVQAAAANLNSSVSVAAAVFYCLSSGSGTRTPTVSTTGTTTDVIAHMSEWNGITATGGTSVTNTGTTGTPATTGTYTQSQANEVIIAVMGESGVTTTDNPSNPPTNWTVFSPNAAYQPNGSAFMGFEASYIIAASSSGRSASWTYAGGASNWATAIAGFKYTPAGAAGLRPQFQPQNTGVTFGSGTQFAAERDFRRTGDEPINTRARFPQRGLSIALQPYRKHEVYAEEYWRVSEDLAWYRPLIPQIKLAAWRLPEKESGVRAEEFRRVSEDLSWYRPLIKQYSFRFQQTPYRPHGIEAEGFRKVSDDGWGLFRPYWTPPPVGGPPYFVYYARRDGWKVEAEPFDARRELIFHFTQTALAAWRQPEKESGVRAEEFRRVSEDLAWYRPLIPQTRLAAWRQILPNQVEAEGFRRVSDDVWGAYRPYWTPPVVQGVFYNVRTRPIFGF
jgi:hypothetical protein